MQLSWLESGAAEPKRPRPIRVRAQRGLMRFESKEAALRWSVRHVPLRAADTRSLSAHPRPVKLDDGEWCLVYDGLGRKLPARWVLGQCGRLLPKEF
jgi:hypothetical protein